MPNHWETSARPLFVKTVFVNGNRHAILFQEDPLLRCGKKISRPSSSLSFASDLSITFSDSRDSGSEGKTSKQKNTAQGRDLSSELQSCLVKLKLASGNLELHNKSTADKCLCNSKESGRNHSREKESSKQKKHKWNHEKAFRRKQSEEFYDESNEFKWGGGGRRNNQGNSCYVYNLENYKGKKKYCFVKISSQPPQFILNCCCEKNSNETHDHQPPNNLVISATIHNLVMTAEGNKSLLHNTLDYIFPFQNAELHWNNYLTKSYYNSLSDRVFQWLDLARKRKMQLQKLNATREDDSANSNNNTERIFSGKRFLGERTEFAHKQETRILMNKKTEKDVEKETKEDEEGEVVGERPIETLLSTEKFQDCLRTPTKAVVWPHGVSEQQKPQNRENFSVTSDPTKTPAVFTRDVSLPVSPLKIQDLLLNFDTRDSNKRKIKESCNPSPRTSKPKVTDKNGNDFLLSRINSWEKRIGDEDIFSNKFDTDSQWCQLNRNLDEAADKIGNPISTEESAERNQKSINNLNITRASPILIQNLLSPQQPHKTCYSEKEKIVWAAEKNTGRPQLHIFMPSVLRKDHSDDSMSECESFLNS